MALVYAQSGDIFSHAVRRVQNEMKPSEDYLDLNFNDVVIRVYHDSNINDLAVIYDLKRELSKNQ